MSKGSYLAYKEIKGKPMLTPSNTQGQKISNETTFSFDTDIEDLIEH